MTISTYILIPSQNQSTRRVYDLLIRNGVKSARSVEAPHKFNVVDFLQEEAYVVVLNERIERIEIRMFFYRRKALSRAEHRRTVLSRMDVISQTTQIYLHKTAR